MIDQDLRRSLSQDVRRLVTGRMTNEEFEDVFFAKYESSEDLAIRAIAEWCYGLYSSVELVPHRLVGRNAVAPEMRRTAVHSVLFLRSGHDYEWPDLADDPFLRSLAGIAISIGLPAGIALLLLCTAFVPTGLFAALAPYAAGGLLLNIGSAWLISRWNAWLNREWDSCTAAGDYDVWPFLREDDLNGARQSTRLLARNPKTGQV